MNRVLVILIILLPLGLDPPAQSEAAVISFEDLSDSTPVADQYRMLGPVFSTGIVVESGISLFEQEYPPYGGEKALLVETGMLELRFDTPATRFGAYVTYASPLWVLFYDSAGNAVETFSSQFSSNLALCGDIGSNPNEYFGLEHPHGLSRVAFRLTSGCGTFVVDEISVVTVDEPPIWTGLFLGFLGIGLIVAVSDSRDRQS
ncbi:MAG: hypothetical protein A4E67_02161 [Syntrophaceae bacterium PtaB.Bin038]|nr:MAG: hypothetical protein A4E67_02161 [Syntrophaceae bacterium PtaB.Bin038]